MVALPTPLSNPLTALAVLALPGLEDDNIGGGGKLIISPSVLFDCNLNSLASSMSDLSTRISRRKIFEEC
jgi:hypothetical protein